ncbi:MAG: hypothetical protein MI806_26150 [Minwuiales bacterium]|nr:hypothetical protein [Minwuiales bacterium]
MEVVLPNQWWPRDYQLPLWRYLSGGGKRAVAVWHRRAGKDSTALNFTAIAAHQRVGTYWHMLPLATQGRKVVWDGIDRSGRRVIDQVFPQPLRKATNKQEMKIELKCGSIWQVVGSDNYNALIGANPVGVVFSEYAVADPAAWDYIRPSLAENGGWALFIYTPRGRNHGASLYDLARERENWFADLLTVDNTGAIPLAAIDEEREAGMSDEIVQQEFYCSFDAPLVGAYYAKLISDAETEGRIGNVPHEPQYPVHTAWDLGIGDSTAIWFFQQVGREVRLIDHYEASGVGLDHFAKTLKDKPYVYGDHLAPHDAEVRELGTGRSRRETLAGLGIKIRVVPRLGLDDGINAARLVLPRCWIDAGKCKRGLDALRQYRREWDAALKAFKDRPLHDWASHSADAFRYLAVGLKGPPKPGGLNKPNTGWIV